MVLPPIIAGLGLVAWGGAKVARSNTKSQNESVKP
jgi:hypothetical protein